jgi:hypothetical protein
VPDWGEPGDGGPDGPGPHGDEPGEPDGSGPHEGQPDGSGRHGRETDGLEQDGRELGELTYWRRRFVALAVGLGILSLIAWAFSGTLGASGAGGSTTSGGAHASHRHADAATARSGESGSAVRPGARPLASAPATPRPSASVQPSPSAAPGQLAVFAPQRATYPARACKASNVVISLVVAQDSYGKGQLPEFDVDVVSTAARTCAFNVGARHLAVVVRAQGKRLWDSADCAAGRGTLTTDLVRGVPVIVPVSWNRQTSARACQGDGKNAPAGGYTASASDGAAASSPVRFALP